MKSKVQWRCKKSHIWILQTVDFYIAVWIYETIKVLRAQSRTLDGMIQKIKRRQTHCSNDIYLTIHVIFLINIVENNEQ
mgnify:CR=1 FL=1